MSTGKRTTARTSNIVSISRTLLAILQVLQKATSLHINRLGNRTVHTLKENLYSANQSFALYFNSQGTNIAIIVNIPFQMIRLSAARIFFPRTRTSTYFKPLPEQKMLDPQHHARLRGKELEG
jgi:hypothetical protein